MITKKFLLFQLVICMILILPSHVAAGAIEQGKYIIEGDTSLYFLFYNRDYDMDDGMKQEISGNGFGANFSGGYFFIDSKTII